MKQNFKPLEFLRQVRSETEKVVWPTRQETIMSTVAVFIMALIMAIFLFTVDQILAFLVRLILNV